MGVAGAQAHSLEVFCLGSARAPRAGFSALAEPMLGLSDEGVAEDTRGRVCSPKIVDDCHCLHIRRLPIRLMLLERDALK